MFVQRKEQEEECCIKRQILNKETKRGINIKKHTANLSRYKKIRQAEYRPNTTVRTPLFNKP